MCKCLVCLLYDHDHHTFESLHHHNIFAAVINNVAKLPSASCINVEIEQNLMHYLPPSFSPTSFVPCLIYCTDQLPVSLAAHSQSGLRTNQATDTGCVKQATSEPVGATIRRPFTGRQLSSLVPQLSDAHGREAEVAGQAGVGAQHLNPHPHDQQHQQHRFHYLSQLCVSFRVFKVPYCFFDTPMFGSAQISNSWVF